MVKNISQKLLEAFPKFPQLDLEKLAPEDLLAESPQMQVLFETFDNRDASSALNLDDQKILNIFQQAIRVKSDLVARCCIKLDRNLGETRRRLQNNNFSLMKDFLAAGMQETFNFTIMSLKGDNHILELNKVLAEQILNPDLSKNNQAISTMYKLLADYAPSCTNFYATHEKDLLVEGFNEVGEKYGVNFKDFDSLVSYLEKQANKSKVQAKQSSKNIDEKSVDNSSNAIRFIKDNYLAMTFCAVAAASLFALNLPANSLLINMKDFLVAKVSDLISSTDLPNIASKAMSSDSGKICSDVALILSDAIGENNVKALTNGFVATLAAKGINAISEKCFTR